MKRYFSLFIFILSTHLVSSELIEDFLNKHQKQILIHGVRKTSSLDSIFEMGELTAPEKVFLETGQIQNNDKGILPPYPIDKEKEKIEMDRLLDLYEELCEFPEVDQDICLREGSISIPFPWGAVLNYDSSKEKFKLDASGFKNNKDRLVFMQKLKQSGESLGYKNNEFFIKLNALQEKKKQIGTFLSVIFDGFLQRFSHETEYKKSKMMFYLFQELGEYRALFYDIKLYRYLPGKPKSTVDLSCVRLHRTRIPIKEGVFFYLTGLNKPKKWLRLFGAGGVWIIYGYSHIEGFKDLFYPFKYFGYGGDFRNHRAVIDNGIFPIANKGEYFSLSLYDKELIILGTKKNLEPYIKKYPDVQCVFFEDITERQRSRLLGE
ncbi:MAG: hypothetical protein S4CHLAM37_00600 [Chlamydiia bacterium]|nr:hypothetical protein [Chlamydiia bacterium]